MAGVSSANATTLYWEGGAGTWNTSGTNTVWSSSSGNPADSAWPSSGATDAVIHTSAATDIVALGAALTNVDSVLIEQGILNLQGNSLRSDASTYATITVDGGQLREAGGNRNINNPIVIGANGATIFNSGGSGNVNVAGIISGTGDLTLNGTNSILLRSANAYTGTTYIKHFAEIAGGGSFGTGDIVIDMATTATTLYMSPAYHYTMANDINVIRGTFQYNGTHAQRPDIQLTLTGSLNVSSEGAVQLRTGGVFRISSGAIHGVIGGNAANVVNLVKIGGGVLTLTATNTYQSGTTIEGGLINFNKMENFGTGSGNVVLNGGGLQWAAGTTTDVSAKLNATLGAAGGTFDTNGNNVAISTALTGSGGVTKTGLGTLTLSNDTDYAGTTVVSGGVLAFSGSGKLSGTSAVQV
ncbi:MAG: autotransporter-associated beta strand repeat-containing protein, partial [Puniceicoccales bacterium]|nr:autotransporter-associated beta strand repeat-containing protein [Puniceicoccales bacterium]